MLYSKRNACQGSKHALGSMWSGHPVFPRNTSNVGSKSAEQCSGTRPCARQTISPKTSTYLDRAYTTSLTASTSIFFCEKKTQATPARRFGGLLIRKLGLLFDL